MGARSFRFEPWIRMPFLLREEERTGDLVRFRMSRWLEILPAIVGLPFGAVMLWATWLVFTQDGGARGDGWWGTLIFAVCGLFVLAVAIGPAWVRKELVVDAASKTLTAVVRSPWRRRVLVVAKPDAPVLRISVERKHRVLTLATAAGVAIHLGSSLSGAAVDSLAGRLSELSGVPIERAICP